MLKIYGASDDLIIIEGQTEDEIDACGVDTRITFTDGTIVEVLYGKEGMAIWSIHMIDIGDKFDRLEECFNKDAEIYSDILYMKDSAEYLIKEIVEF